MTNVATKMQVPHSMLHVTFTFHAPVNVDDLAGLFNSATDWYRYAPNCWLLWTHANAETWYNHLKPHLADPDYLLIIQLNPQVIMRGWLPKGAWEWMGKYYGPAVFPA